MFADQVAILVILLGAMWLLHRWKDSGDRSAYAVGAFLAIVAPLLALSETLMDVQVLVAGPGAGIPAQAVEPMRTVVSWAVYLQHAVSLAAGLVFLFFATRPWFLTGVFAFAPQAKVRNEYHRIESSWQYAVGTWVAGFVAVYVWGRVGPLVLKALY